MIKKGKVLIGGRMISLKILISAILKEE